ncbi:MAG: type IV toxin-antitoxin system AbiEi family antitoxin [Candidatus Bipolaricaulota bacterium]
MVNIERREDLISECVQHLRSHWGRGCQLAKARHRGLAGVVDAVYRMAVRGGPTFEVGVLARPTLRPSLLASIESDVERLRNEAHLETALVASTYVTESLAGKLRDRGIWFADAAGNAYVQIPGSVLVYVVGKRPAPSPASRAHWMSEQGAKVLYEILACGPLVEATYRDVEESTGVSLGMISKLVSEWVKAGILERRGRGTYEIVHGTRLLEMWVRAYADTLHPRIALGRYRPAGRSDLRAMLYAAAEEMSLEHLTVGGEYAADLLTGGRSAQSLRLYVPEEERGRVQRAFQLVPAPEGSVEMAEAFAGDIGRPSEDLGLRIAHPVLVYAELLAADGAESGRLAVEIRRRHLSWAR